MTVELRASVGAGQVNHDQDIVLVQLLLNLAAPAGLAVTGVWDQDSAAALAAFQNTTFGFADGSINPGDITFKRLRGSISTATNPLQDTIRRMLVLSNLGLADPPDPPPLGQRKTTDGFGTVVEWPDGGGSLVVFSHQTFGTWEVRGAILARYEAIGVEGGALGNPISGERDAPTGGGDRVSYFEHGRIVFTAATLVAGEIV